jgi:NAD(P)-dependent dehydrogenase (short-subunit alcohol dehydrogenase family)
MKIAGSTALVTGANRGLGAHLAQQLLERGASVYAAARDPGTVTLPGVTPVRLDITDPASVAAVARDLTDVAILVNNAGSSTGASLVSGDMAEIDLEMRTHYFGTLAMIRGFAPHLAAGGGGAILNVLSVLSWIAFPTSGAYCAAKSAEWALTNAVRQELAPNRTQVTALHVGYMNTDMTSGLDVAKVDPADVARIALDGIEAGDAEILADDVSRHVQAGLAGGVAALY